MPSSVIHLLKRELDKLPKISRIWVAYSGGLDSHVLLHALRQVQNEYEFLLSAIHVNHGLSTHADSWEAHCAEICRQLEIECQSVNINLQSSGRQNLEAAAREARYGAFKTCMNTAILTQSEKDGHYLVTAHHADDQAETFLLQLLRGSGTKGLSAMPVLKPLGQGTLWRPFLPLPRDALVAYAIFHQLKWVEDESNTDIGFDRNYLRHQVIPSLNRRWPHVAQSITQSAKHCREVELLSRELAFEDLQHVEEGAQLNLSKLRELSRVRRHNVLRFWLEQQEFPLPGRVHLHHFEVCFINGRRDANPRLCWSNIQLRRHLDLLYVLPNPYLESCSECFTWNLSVPLQLNSGTLVAEQKRGEGICMNLIGASNSVEIRFRQGGEAMKPEGYAHTRSLKKCFHEWKIPTWERGRIPLVYIDDTLAQVLKGSTSCVATQFAANSDEMGWSLRFLESVYLSPLNFRVNESSSLAGIKVATLTKIEV